MRIEIICKKKTAKKHKHMEAKQYATKQPMDHWGNQRGIFKKYLETNKNGNITHQNLWDAAKAVLRRKFIAINAYIKKKYPK